MQITLSCAYRSQPRYSKLLRFYLAPRTMEHSAAEFFDSAGAHVILVALAVSLVLICKDHIHLALLR
jgi:hypothetical protein